MDCHMFGIVRSSLGPNLAESWSKANLAPRLESWALYASSVLPFSAGSFPFALSFPLLGVVDVGDL
jgi:hypothetical protein